MEIDAKKRTLIDLNKELSASELKRLSKIAKDQGCSPRQQATKIIFEYLTKNHKLEKDAIQATSEESNERR